VSHVLAASHTSSGSSNSSAGGVLGTTTTLTTRGGVQAGFGGMAADTASSPTWLAFAGGGILLVLASAFGLTPLRRGSRD
jgi:hypothetical protein